MKKYRIPLAYNTLQHEEIEAAIQVLRNGQMTQGPAVAHFETVLAQSQGTKHAIMVNSGSSANLIAIEAMVYCSKLKSDITYGPLRPGDEVIMQGLGWPTTIKPLLNHNLQPVYCDVNLGTLSATVATIEAVRSPKTRAVIAVPILGNPDGLGEIRVYCEKNRLVLIEDACESLGAATLSGKKVGTLGLASALSFYFSHHISTVEGGAILTDSPDIADLCYALRSHGWTRHFKLNRIPFYNIDEIDPRFCFVLPGYNVRSTEISAAIGTVQLRRFPQMLINRRRIARARIEAIKPYSDSLTVPGSNIIDRHSWMAFPLLFRDKSHRRTAQERLEAFGIETRPIIAGNLLRHPLTRMHGLKNDQPELPACDKVFERGLMIGLNPFSTYEAEAHVHFSLQAVASM